MARRPRAACACAALLLACLVAAAAGTAASPGAPVNEDPMTNEWGICGGLGGPGAVDAANHECPDGYTCVRQDQ